MDLGDECLGSDCCFSVNVSKVALSHLFLKKHRSRYVFPYVIRAGETERIIQIKYYPILNDELIILKLKVLELVEL